MLTDPELKALHAEFVQGLAALEIALPVNWCTITHHLLLHIADTYAYLGAFWSHNNLPTERLHVKLHNLARGYKNMMRSFGRHYDLFDFSTITRFEGPSLWMSRPAASSLASERKVESNDGVVHEFGQQTKGKINHSLMEQVKDLWSIENKAFRRLRERYETEKSRQPQGTVPAFRHWQPKGTRLSEEQQDWTQMSKNVKVMIYLIIFIFS
jgi:hypothetical protein